jgi:hypothetical protein
MGGCGLITAMKGRGDVSGLEQVPSEMPEALSPPAAMMTGWTRSEVPSEATVGDDDEMIWSVAGASRCRCRRAESQTGSEFGRKIWRRRLLLLRVGGEM